MKFNQILPHIIAVVVFLLITVVFFKPVFFDNKTLSQGDILQWEGSSKELRDFRNETGEEGLWASAMFSGMPAYLVNVNWSDGIITNIKKILSLWLPHPVRNIFLACLCYYIMLLCFGIRPYLAMAGAIAFGFSSYMIIGLMAGHNARIGAIALLPLLMAGVHLVYSGKRIVGFAMAAAGLALHLRESHVQITYYFLFILLAYALMQLVLAIRNKTVPVFIKSSALLLAAAILAIGTYFGQLWSTYEYSKYSMRGPSEIKQASADGAAGLAKNYAFEYSNGIIEPMVLMIPNFFGGGSSNYFVQDRDSESYQALMRAGDQQTAEQLARFTSAYWGEQPATAPYYAGAIIVFLFVLGIVFAPRQYMYWLVPVSVLSIMLSWGNNFEAFNYFMFDHFPMYNKFRSVTFALMIILFAMPLLGLLGLEALLKQAWSKALMKKLLWPVGLTAGLCLLLALTGGFMSFLREGETDLPAFFFQALQKDRAGLLKADAWRSFFFIAIAAVGIYFTLRNKISVNTLGIALSFLILIDLFVIDKRYLNENNFVRNAVRSYYQPTAADQEIMKLSKPGERVFNLQGAWQDARTSYFHHSVGGYHGAKMRRYQEFYDSCLSIQYSTLMNDARSGNINLEKYTALSMLNTRFFVYGPDRNNFILNTENYGAAWFVADVQKVNTALEELKASCVINPKRTAVIDQSKFQVADIKFDSTATVNLLTHKPNYLSYEVSSNSDGLLVFSEIYYPVGWEANINGSPAEILRANFILRAMQVPAGKHKIEFHFKPKAYYTGNKVTFASSVLLLLVILGAIGFSLKRFIKP
jgi:hypothetical protein